MVLIKCVCVCARRKRKFCIVKRGKATKQYVVPSISYVKLISLFLAHGHGMEWPFKLNHVSIQSQHFI